MTCQERDASIRTALVDFIAQSTSWVDEYCISHLYGYCISHLYGYCIYMGNGSCNCILFFAHHGVRTERRQSRRHRAVPSNAAKKVSSVAPSFSGTLQQKYRPRPQSTSSTLPAPGKYPSSWTSRWTEKVNTFDEYIKAFSTPSRRRDVCPGRRTAPGQTCLTAR